MPNLITPPELAEEIANLMGIYGCHTPRCGDHESLKDCACRICFVTDLTERIRQATINEHMLHTQGRFAPLAAPGAASTGPVERRLEWGLSERQDAVNTLRQVCEEFGDNDWPDDLHLGDAIEKHLWRNLEARSPEAAWPEGNAGQSLQAIARALEDAGRPMPAEVRQIANALHAEDAGADKGREEATPGPGVYDVAELHLRTQAHLAFLAESAKGRSIEFSAFGTRIKVLGGPKDEKKMAQALRDLAAMMDAPATDAAWPDNGRPIDGPCPECGVICDPMDSANPHKTSCRWAPGREGKEGDGSLRSPAFGPELRPWIASLRACMDDATKAGAPMLRWRLSTIADGLEVVEAIHHARAPEIREPAIIPRNGQRTHILKCHPAPFSALLAGKKGFEWRKFDRDFKVGDVLMLNEYDPERDQLTGTCVQRRITYLLSAGFGIPAGYCIMSIEPLEASGASTVSVSEPEQSPSPLTSELPGAEAGRDEA